MASLTNPASAVIPRRPIVRCGKTSHKPPARSRSRFGQYSAAPSPKTPSEKFVEQQLRRERIRNQYEPYEFDLGRKGFKPDFYCVDYGVWFEVTEGNAYHEATKLGKIRRVMTLHNALIILIDRETLRNLETGSITLRQILANAGVTEAHRYA